MSVIAVGGQEDAPHEHAAVAHRLRGRVLATVAAGAVAYRRRTLSVVGAA